MLDLLKRIAERPFIGVEFVLSTVLINLLGLATPIFVILVLNRYVAYGVDTTLATLAAGALFAIVMEFGFREARLRLAGGLFDGPASAIGVEAFERLLRTRSQSLGAIAPAMRQEILKAPETLQQASAPANVTAIVDVPFALLFLGVIYLISPLLAGAVALIIVLLGLVNFVVTRRLRTLNRDHLLSQSSRNHLAAAAIHQPDTVRQFSAAAFMLDRWRQVSGESNRLRDAIAHRQGFVASLIVLSQAITGVLVISLGALMVVDGRLDIGSMIGVNILAARTLGPVARTIQLSDLFARARVARSILGELFALPVEKADGARPSETEGRISADRLHFRWPQATHPLFEGLSFSIGPGETAVISGANGTGKTTLARLLTGLLEPESGSVTLDGMDSRQLAPDWWRREVAYVPQEPGFLPGTLRENLIVADPAADDAMLAAAIDRTGLRRFVDQSSHGLDMQVTADGRNLPPGIRRRIAFARVLIGDASIVIADEPTEAMDKDGRDLIYEALNAFRRAGRAIVLCSTDPYLIKGADWVIDLNARPARVVDLKAARAAQENSRLQLLDTEEAAS